MQASKGKWAGRFIWASVVQGIFAVFWTIFIVAPGVVPEPSRVIAGGSGGTWLFVGYVLYILIGVVAVAVTALFYFYIEGIQGKIYSGLRNLLAWAHLVLMNVGAAGATWLMMTGGYLAGRALLPTSVGGLGWNPGQVHVNILQYYPQPLFIFVVVATAGVLLGGLGYVVSERTK